MNVTGHAAYSGSVFVADPAHPIAQGVSSPYTGLSGSSRFATSDGHVIADDAGTMPVVIIKEIGNGDVILIEPGNYLINVCW